MITIIKNIVDLKFKREEKILDFNDFQKQNIKFDINKLRELIIKLFKLKNLKMVVV